MNREDAVRIVEDAKRMGEIPYLSGANLSGANLYGTNLYGTNLSGVVGLLSQREWLREHCEVKGGLLVAYKVEAHTIDVKWPKTWAWEPGAVLEEVVNPCRTHDCACGVNVGTREWCERNAHEGAPVWRVLVDPCGAVVPYNTDGKFRAEWVRLVEIVGGEG